MRSLVCLVFLVAVLQLSASLLLGAFNIKSFGDTKCEDHESMNIISTIIRRYDIILIQEVRDTDLSATNSLMTYVNGATTTYDYVVSAPLGPSTYKERYLFIYKTLMVTKVDEYQYIDSKGVFSRPPFIVKFSSTQTAVREFVLIPQHTSPSSAVMQIDALYDVVTDAYNHWTVKDIVLLGDFNAGCDYVRRADWRNIRLFTDQSFHWLITDQADTTVGRNGCPYDRIVVTDDMNKRIVPNSAEVYDYEVAMGLTPQKAKDVSDHFPVGVTLAPAPAGAVGGAVGGVTERRGGIKRKKVGGFETYFYPPTKVRKLGSGLEAGRRTGRRSKRVRSRGEQSKKRVGARRSWYREISQAWKRTGGV